MPNISEIKTETAVGFFGRSRKMELSRRRRFLLAAEIILVGAILVFQIIMLKLFLWN
jgi:hypothetical protein